MTTPFHLRKLRSDMALKGLSLKDVSDGTKVPYTYASEILKGSRVNPKALEKISKFIEKAQMPEEVKK